MTSADLFERQFLHCNSALKTSVHWYLENLRKWTLSSGPREVPHSSRDLHSCRGKAQFPGGHDPPHGTDLEQKSKVHHCSHWSFPSCCDTQKLKDRAKSLLCFPKKANLTEIRPQQRHLHQTNLSFWLCGHQIIIHSQAEALSNLWS